MRGMICDNTSIVTMGILYGLAGAGAAAICQLAGVYCDPCGKEGQNDDQEMQELVT